MIKNIHINFYIVKGKAQEIISCAEDSEQNKILELAESNIASLIIPTLKIEKKAVYFVIFEGDYVESGRLKNQTECKCVKTDYTPATFRKAHRDMIKADAKAMNKIDLEKNYS